MAEPVGPEDQTHQEDDISGSGAITVTSVKNHTTQMDLDWSLWTHIRHGFVEMKITQHRLNVLRKPRRYSIPGH